MNGFFHNQGLLLLNKAVLILKKGNVGISSYFETESMMGLLGSDLEQE